MKNWLLLFLASIAFTNSYSQEILSQKTANKDRVETLSLKWNNNTNTYDSVSRFLYSYSNSAPEEISIYQIYENDKWQNAFRTSNYSEDSVITEYWDTINNNYRIDLKTYYTYNSTDDFEETIEYKIVSGQSQLKRYSKRYFVSDSIKSALVNLFYDNGSILLGDSTFILYDTTTRIQLLEKYDFVSQNQWIPEIKRFSYYNSNKNLDSMIYFEYLNGTFENDIRIIYTRVGNPPKVISINQSWDSNINSWTDYMRTTESYTNYGRADTILYEMNTGSGFVPNTLRVIEHDSDHELKNIYTLRYSNNQWNNFFWTQFYYAQGAGIFDQISKNLLVFPNPTEGKITVKVPHIEKGADMRIYNNSGKIIFAERISDEFFTVDISDLPAGLYFIEVNTPEGKFIQKSIKK